MGMKWTWKQLPTGYRTGGVYESYGRWRLEIYPDMGDMMIEGNFESEEEATLAGEEWIRGEKTERTKRIYSASY